MASEAGRVDAVLTPVRRNNNLSAHIDEHDTMDKEEEKLEISFDEGIPLGVSTDSIQPKGYNNSPQRDRNPVSSSVDAIAGNKPTSSTAPTTLPPPSQARKVYRFKSNKFVTREIAALDFLLGIPMAAEERIVHEGIYMQAKQEQEMDASDEDDLTATRNLRGGDSGADLMNIPRDVVVAAAAPKSKGRWWEKWIKDHPSRVTDTTEIPAPDDTELELPVESRPLMERTPDGDRKTKHNTSVLPQTYVPGRRLEGDEAVRVQIPLTTQTLTKQRTIARQAALREWELQTAHGLKHTSAATTTLTMTKSSANKGVVATGHQQHPPMLDGRLFFSAAGSYPLSVFSLIRYEPKKEEMQQRRQKLEARGGGGTQFIMPARDWRGISYRALLPRKHYRHHDSPFMEETNPAFNRFLHNNNDANKTGADLRMENDGDDGSLSSHSSDDSDVYEPGVLDDPAMVLGRHRHVMIGDRTSGPIVSSTIQFVRPSLLKSELNKQFRERFDGWEPPREARKYIGAKVVDGAYVLMDPAEDDFPVRDGDDNNSRKNASSKRSRQGSVSSSSVASGDAPSTIVPKELRIPPSLTLSKIRSLKQHALAAAIEANLEIGTVALSCVYFERLALDCRVDKSNRRLVFATCLLLASKLNEPFVGLVKHSADGKGTSDGVASRLQSLVRPNKRSRNIFASLLEFFTEKWNLSLKHLFAAEWGVFAALGFSLHAKPSQVSFHYKRLMKQKGWSPRIYLGEEMYAAWQSELEKEDERKRTREQRRDRARRQKEVKLLNIGIEMENERRKAEERGAKSSNSDNEDNMLVTRSGMDNTDAENTDAEKEGRSPRKSGMRLFDRFGMRRIGSRTNLFDQLSTAGSEHRRSMSRSRRRKGAAQPASPSMPAMPSSETTLTASTVGAGPGAVGLPRGDGEADEASSIGSVAKSDMVV